jgi:hypothetical protein
MIVKKWKFIRYVSGSEALHLKDVEDHPTGDMQTKPCMNGAGSCS